MTLAIGVDIGGTKAAVGVVDECGQVIARTQRMIAGKAVEAALAEMVNLISEVRAQHEVTAVGIGVAGLLDSTRTGVAFAANLAWVDVPLGEIVSASTHLPTLIEGDANCAAWGEYRFGAARHEAHLVMLTVGTGVGGGVIDDGSIRHGATGLASEVGHLQIDPDGLACECGARGCLEQYASGKALVTRAQELCHVQPSRAGGLFALGDGTPQGICGEHVTEAARRGDPLAAEAFRGVADWLGRGLAVLTAVLDPGCFVLGGGVSDAGSILLDPVRTSYERHLPAGNHRSPAPVRLAKLGSDAGLVGAADLARTR